MTRVARIAERLGFDSIWLFGHFHTHHTPVLETTLAKMASRVDVLSHGRLDFGIGAGWHEQEFLACGYPYPVTADRLRMLREALQIIHAMSAEPMPRSRGRTTPVSGAINEPKGVQKPHPPVWIGGSGEKVTLKLAARHGHATNFGGHLDDMSRTATSSTWSGRIATMPGGTQIR
jgi:alkanesulfonate monooxygenase SsuD/methylene tetrahydromethanopterin reductase-like flavin-dependent oxidoreductase (luciferase family)